MREMLKVEGDFGGWARHPGTRATAMRLKKEASKELELLLAAALQSNDAEVRMRVVRYLEIKRFAEFCEPGRQE